jgi:CRP-like cAMP-binding protein
MTNPLARKLAQYDVLSEEENQLLDELIEQPEKIVAHTDLVSEGSRPTESVLLLEGYCARYKSITPGKRQFTAIHIAGDFLDLHSFLIKKMDHSVLTLTPCVIVRVPHARLTTITERHPHLTRLLWLTTLIDSSIHRQWLTVMATLDGLRHFAHLICETYVRLSAQGVATDYRYTLPMTRDELSAVLGLSPVHVSHLFQDLRQRGLIEQDDSLITIPDWPALATFAKFDPTYLSIGQEPR